MAEESSGGKPGDFFVGLVDFFAILLPGGLLAFLTYTSLRRWGAIPTGISMPEGWVGFAVVGLVSYLLGHLLSVIPALCLDPVYDWWKNTHSVLDNGGWATDAQPAKRLNALWESLKDLEDEHKLAGEKLKLKDAVVTLRIASSGAAAEMDHLEADQKFFRGLILVFLFAWLTFFWDWKWNFWDWNWKAIWKAIWPSVGIVLLLLQMFPWRIFKRMLSTRPNWKREVAIAKLFAIIVLFVCWILWFATTPRMSAWPPAVSGGSKTENPALSVNASVGNLSVTAKSENNENSDVSGSCVMITPQNLEPFCCSLWRSQSYASRNSG